MVTALTRKRIAYLGLAVVLLSLLAWVPASFAQEEHGEEVSIPVDPNTVGNAIRVAGLAIGAGIAMAAASLGTARAQAAVGAGGTGALAEKPELFGNVLILFAIPETIVVLGFVTAFLIIGKV